MGAQMPQPKPSEKTVWIQNKHGVKIAVPESLAKWRIENYAGFAYCEPENVPAEKEYPDDVMLTEAGSKRRKQARDKQSKKESQQDSVMEDLVPAEVPTDLGAKIDAGGILTKDEYRAVEWMQLRKYATGRGLEVKKMKRPEILVELDKSHQ